MMEMVSYTQVDGIWTFRDSQVLELLGRASAEGILEHMCLLSPGKCLAWLKDDRSAELIVVFDDGEPYFLILIDAMQQRRGHIHFCAFKKFWGDPVRLKGVTLGVFSVLLERFSVLIGMVSKDNEHAQHFLARYGVPATAEIPGYFQDIQSGRSIAGLMYLFTKES